MKIRLLPLCMIALLLLTVPVEGAEVRFSDAVGGVVRKVAVRENDSLVELARTYDVGYNAITAANPGIDPFVPPPGIDVVIPTRYILPDAPSSKGIVINISEMRLYYFTGRHGIVETFPVGIGDEGWETPEGSYSIVEKITHPAWYVPASIRAQKPELPQVVPPGPDNPLGSHALRLSIGTVLIHGTDRPFGIGRRVSHGCIHLYPEDIVSLFRKVPLDTKVHIVRQPVKVTVTGGRVLMEVHQDGTKDLRAVARDVLQRRVGERVRVDGKKFDRVLEECSGLPTDVTLDGI